MRRLTPVVKIEPEWLNTEQAAEFTGFTRPALERMRNRKEGPVYSKIGRSIRYSIKHLREWMESCTTTNH